MKNIYLLIGVALFLFSCDDDYKLSTDFTVPTELFSPEFVELDVKSQVPVVFSWKGGGTSDGSYVTYEVLFDKEGGDFSTPLDKRFSSNGTAQELLMLHEDLNAIARKAGISSGETGKLIWTVTASKGGLVSPSNITKTLTVKRGEGIDAPQSLYLFGSATENGGSEGLPFRVAKDGVFVIYTKIQAGTFCFKSGTDAEAINYYLQGTQLVEGDGDLTLTPSANPYRITVNFNTLSMQVEDIGQVKAIWGATFDAIGILQYQGNGIFGVDNCVIEFIAPDRPQTNPPGWLSWTEDRYYFIAEVDGIEKCWGRMDNVSAENPIGGEPLSFYELGEFAWGQWDHLWKMALSLDQKKATITIDTNKENLMVHEFTNVIPM